MAALSAYESETPEKYLYNTWERSDQTTVVNTNKQQGMKAIYSKK